MPKAKPVMNNARSKSAALAVLAATKSYGAVRALSDVTLVVEPGEVHGLIGQNGAGKSTLVSVASGAVVPDSGQVLIGGESSLGDPNRARQLGLAIVRQEPALMADLTVAENLYLGVSEAIRPPMNQVKAWASELLGRWSTDCAIDAAARVNTLSAEHRFIVDIVRALAGNPRVLVLDEPTEHLQAKDVDRLFACIAEITAAGTGVVYISHRIREVRQIADRVTVLRDGQGQGTYDVDGLSEERIIELIIGTSVSAEFPAKAQRPGTSTPILSVIGQSGHGMSKVSMQLFPGEIVGLAGVDGNGQRDFLRSLAGLNPGRGEVQLRGRRIELQHPDQAANERIQYISNDRHGESVFEDLSITANFSLRSLARDLKFGLVNGRSESRRATGGLKALAVKFDGQDDQIRSLSGGNQQKVVLGSVLATEPVVLLVDEPTQGVDIGSRLEIYRILRQTVQQDRGAIVLSSDAAELAGLCDRVLVFSRGSVAAELIGDAVTESEIISSILTATNSRHEAGNAVSRRAGDKSLVHLLATDWAPLAMVSVVVVLLGAYAAFMNENYLSVRNFSGMLALVSTLGLVACAQQALMVVGGIDLSVGPLMGLIVVCQSFLLSGPVTSFGLAGSVAAVLIVALAVGFFNWVLVEPIGLHPMVATLATFTALQAVSLILRPTSDGMVNEGVMDAINMRFGFVPLSLLVVIGLAAALDFGLFRKYLGLSARGLGSNPDSARLAGISPAKTRLIAYLSCSLIAGLASISLLGQVGIGDPRAGIDYTLTSIAAVVIGGGSLYGARGSFVGALLGSLLIMQVNVVTTFLGLSEAWQAYLLGGMIIAAVAVHSKSRQLVLAG
jgi:ribose transport system ATP-binding protein